MIAPNEFWLCVHQLADAYDAEGLTAEERAESIVDELRKMPPITQRQVLGDLSRLVGNLSDLHTLTVAAANANEKGAGLEMERAS